MVRKNPIGVFDSGIGGLATLKYLQKKLPCEDFIYYADEAHFPYGQKSTEELLVLVDKIIKYFQNANVKLIVIACNTVSSLMTRIEAKYDIPLFDVITPTIRSTLKMEDVQSILLLATSVTVRSKCYENKLLSVQSHNYQIKSVICSDFTSLVEAGDWDSPIIAKTLATCPTSDLLILGCTHYSFLKEKINRLIPQTIIIDSALEVVTDVYEYLNKHQLLNQQQKGRTKFVTNGDFIQFKKKVERIFEANYNLN